MANELTGDFDVVAEFSVPAANRVLAAMHRIERFPHSMALRVDDDPPPGSKVGHTVVAGVDMFGDPPADHTKLGTLVPFPGVFGGDPAHSPLDSIVNVDAVVATVGPLVPSHLRGRAQLQLSPPTLQLAAGGGNNLTVRLKIMSRYFPDPQTTPVAEFVHGELRMTAAVNQVASQTGSVVDIDIKANTLTIGFNPIWSSQPLTAENIAGVEQLIRNALKTSFLPSNITLPPSVRAMQFKTVPAGQGAIAVLLNTTAGAPGNPGSVTNVFLGGGDDFAFAAGIEFIRAQFQSTIDVILGTPLAPIHLKRTVFGHTFDYVYTVSLTSATVDLQGGKIVLTIDGHAHTGSWLPDFSFRARQPFTLSPAGATVELVVESVSLDITSGGVTGWLVSLFKGNAVGPINQQRDEALEQNHVRETVRHTLSAEENFGAVLKSLLTPTGRRAILLLPGYQLAYTAVEIRPSAIVLHGSLAVAAGSPAHVEFEEIPTTAVGAGGAGVGELPHGPDYSALKTWIPGGTIQRYDWSSQGQAQPFRMDEHRFVLIHAGPEASTAMSYIAPVSGYTPLCLTVRGVRLSSSGPVVEQPVTASVCGYGSFPIVDGLAVAFNGALPLVALTHPSPRGTVEVAGHTAAGLADAGGRAPNLILHFADERTAGRLDFLVQALREASRTDAATAIVAVLAAGQLTNARYTEGVVYAEDQGGAWERTFGVHSARRPLTLIVAPGGKVVWQHEGELDTGSLAAALGKVLTSGGSVTRGMLRSNLRIGQLPPNFLFDYAPGRQLTLRKLVGQPITLVFWKSSSRPSIEAVRGLKPIVLAINDGEAPEQVKRSATEHGLSATIVTDPKRQIALAYGVNVWPTIVVLDASGVVRAIRYGRLEH